MTLQPRTRPRSRLPPYTTTQRPRGPGYFDRCVVHFPNYHIRAATARELTQRFRSQAAAGALRISNAANLIVGGRRWLFTVKVKIPGLTEQGNAISDWRLLVTIDLNLTRYIHHHGLPTRADETFREQLLQPRTEFQHPGLDGNDNYVPNERIRDAIEANWPREMRHLLALICRQIDDALFPDYDPDDTIDFMSREPRIRQILYDPKKTEWSVRQIETYWEFQKQDAISQIEILRYQLPQLAYRMRAIHYELRRNEDVQPTPAISLAREDQIQSAQSLSIPLGAQDMRLGIYAKMSDRIRFEIRAYDEVRRGLGRQGSLAQLPNRNLEDFEQFVRAIELNHRNRLWRFFSALPAPSSTDTPTPERLAEFLTGLHAACQADHDRITSILTQLIAHSRLVLERTPTDRLLGRRLIDDSLFVRRSAAISGTGSVYQLNARYRPIVENLRRSLASGPDPSE